MAAGVVAETLRASDGERYFAALLAPPEAREALTALHAFDAELARTRESVRDPALGEIRLQWWREAVEGRRAEEAAGNPLASALLAAIDRHRLPRPALLAMIEARRADLYDDTPPGRGDLEGRFGETSGALLQLGAIVLAPTAARDVADASGHGGCVLGVAELLRTFAASRRRGRCVVPADMLAELALDRAAILDDGAAAARAAAALAGFGLDHYRRFRAAIAAAPSAARPAFLIVAPAARLVARALHAPGRFVDGPAPVEPVRARWAMLRAAVGKWQHID